MHAREVGGEQVREAGAETAQLAGGAGAGDNRHRAGAGGEHLQLSFGGDRLCDGATGVGLTTVEAARERRRRLRGQRGRAEGKEQ